MKFNRNPNQKKGFRKCKYFARQNYLVPSNSSNAYLCATTTAEDELKNLHISLVFQEMPFSDNKDTTTRWNAKTWATWKHMRKITDGNCFGSICPCGSSSCGNSIYGSQRRRCWINTLVRNCCECHSLSRESVVTMENRRVVGYASDGGDQEFMELIP